MSSSSTPSTTSTPQAISVFIDDDRLYHGDKNDRSTWCQLPAWADPGDKCNCGKMQKARPRATPCPWAKPTITTTTPPPPPPPPRWPKSPPPTPCIRPQTARLPVLPESEGGASMCDKALTLPPAFCTTPGAPTRP
ncbi:hypothetical protein IWX90DRAFT_414688 [Phyllosticta citrichinensis]|uniref:Uncharacterized protein n=1 Tax=Phyllosticta citrichinensis TaxID=1130410 RepID=A0ABR1XSL5_9PEZI